MADDRLGRAAVHEAGHAVAHVRLGLEHYRVRIDPRTAQVLGSPMGVRAKPVRNAEHARLVALAHCAGYAALIVAGHSEADALLGTRDEFATVKGLIEHWGLAGDMKTWKAQAVELMGRPENVAAVELAAKHLLNRRNLDTDWVGCVLALLDGEMTQDEFAAYVRFREALG